MLRMICGKYDSLWKREWNSRIGRFTGRLERGVFDTAMNYARKNRGGIRAIEHCRNQPWESWRSWR